MRAIAHVCAILRANRTTFSRAILPKLAEIARELARNSFSRLEGVKHGHSPGLA